MAGEDGGLSAEWMFADGGEESKSSSAPSRWTGALALSEALAQLEELGEEDYCRPLLLRLPACEFTPAERFKDADEATSRLRAAMRTASGRCVRFSSSVGSGAEPEGAGQDAGLTTEWMFGDAAKGPIGFHAMAHLNPFRWSGSLSLEGAIAQLEVLVPKDRPRPVIVRIPAGIFSHQVHFASSGEAMGHLQRTLARSERAAKSWAVELTSFLCEVGQEHLFQGKAPLLDPSAFSSVQLAVDRLNVDEALCPGGLCVVCSKRLDGGYVLIFRADKREEAKALFGLGALSWREFAKRRDSKDGYRIGDIARGLLGRMAFLGDVWGRTGRFDGKKLVVVRAGRLEERYDVLRELGRGAQGAASLLRRRRTGQEYVAKETLSVKKDALEDMRAELEKMQVLRHPHCAKLVEFLESRAEQRAITISEFAQRGDLAKYLSEVALTGAGAASIFKQAMAGVAFLHASGCVHNDLKPENLLVFAGRRDKEAPRVAITDYGCARYLVKDQRLKFGDPRYMSPENVRAMMDFMRSDTICEVEFRPAGDVWSMGVTLFEVLSKGVLPFLYEPCSLTRVQEEVGIFERLQEGVLAPEEVDYLSHCAAVPSSLAPLLPALLEKNEYMRPTAQKVLAHLKESEEHTEEPAPRGTRHLELSVQQHRACQILLNCMMWRLQSQHVDALYEVFECFNTSNSGRVSREEFKQALSRFSEDASRADDLFDMADIDGDDSLEFNEFASIGFDWGSMIEEELDKHIQELLEDLSEGGEGKVKMEELAEFFGSAVERGELVKLFMRIDERNVGYIEAPDLRSFLQRHRASALPAVVCEVPVR